MDDHDDTPQPAAPAHDATALHSHAYAAPPGKPRRVPPSLLSAGAGTRLAIAAAASALLWATVFWAMG